MAIANRIKETFGSSIRKNANTRALIHCITYMYSITYTKHMHHNNLYSLHLLVAHYLNHVHYTESSTYEIWCAYN